MKARSSKPKVLCLKHIREEKEKGIFKLSLSEKIIFVLESKSKIFPTYKLLSYIQVLFL